MEKNNPKGSIPAITGDIDHSKAIRVFPESLSPYKSTILAYTTSFVSTTIGFPFDTVKTRMQTYKQFASYSDCVLSTLRNEGVRGFYRGITAPLISTSFVRSLSVTIFTNTKPYCYEALYGWRDEKNVGHPFVRNFPVCFAAGAAAGCGVSIFACPFEFTKVYSQIATLASKSATDSAIAKAASPHVGTVETFKTILRYEGFGGLYSGYRYHLARDAMGSGVYFAVYEAIKWATNTLINSSPSQSSPISIMIAGGMSGVLCWIAVFPFDTTKSLIQKDIVTNILRKQGGAQPLPQKTRKIVFGTRVYRGLSISMLRSFLVNMVFFTTYEFGMKHLA
ncbi:hypothetical protein FT663_02182 [Candidozyma haemuli var. vulneris]|uniref:Uncharacterized protein n=1 Tax=Candidozyma haemuli TaxID=45357 RepID=A0A2V1AKK8_9ASCO|nr:hypothetical protein CXQ85_001137 [[Candida] haemuloni]KAF3990340.1 hypothetical protein FT662_02333 [[Candida] haemuloni var. vulneris]KAF3992809.1 hypothetical protein FT663_02182 [[Candida] haemuloni var. vulneris]PVH18847.1 hypothetical protein CXQ85_001137 [[Candida] haemuloni]